MEQPLTLSAARRSDVGRSSARVRTPGGAELNRLDPTDRPAHDWYRFVLSFPPHLVREYLDKFGVHVGQQVLDPFCGTGTTLVECKKHGIPSVGVEANRMASFASRVKVDWGVDPCGLREHARHVAEVCDRGLEDDGVPDVPILGQYNGTAPRPDGLPGVSLELDKLLLANSISPLPLHKTLALLKTLAKVAHPAFDGHERLALARSLVTTIGNLHFGPEVGVGAPKPDAPVVSAWLQAVLEMASDIESLQHWAPVASKVHLADARSVLSVIEPNSIDAVFTSPPYPNEKDYTRTTRLESVLLGFISSKVQLRELKRGLVRPNTRSVYKGDDDDRWVAKHTEIQRIADQIEARRLELGKTSGFERLYAKTTKLYFGGMARHLADLRLALRLEHSSGMLGDQASYLRVMIRTGELLAGIAESLGYEVVGIELFRSRLATATGEQLREEVVVLHWPGGTPRGNGCHDDWE